MWRATFQDDTILDERGSNKEEVLFGKVMERVDELKNLSIILCSGKVYTVSMVDGLFSVPTQEGGRDFYGIDTEKYDLDKLINFRPIYFVRETVEFGASRLSNIQGSRTEFTALGFQANYEERNIKKYLMIFPDGNFVMKDE